MMHKQTRSNMENTVLTKTPQVTIPEELKEIKTTKQAAQAEKMRAAKQAEKVNPEPPMDEVIVPPIDIDPHSLDESQVIEGNEEITVHVDKRKTLFISEYPGLTLVIQKPILDLDGNPMRDVYNKGIPIVEQKEIRFIKGVYATDDEDEIRELCNKRLGLDSVYYKDRLPEHVLRDLKEARKELSVETATNIYSV